MNRIDKYRKKLDSGIIGKRYDATKKIAVDSQTKYFASAEELELKVKSIVSAEPTILHHFYIAFAEELEAKKTNNERRIIFNKWYSRGLNECYLRKISGALFNYLPIRAVSGMIGYWPFCEGKGVVANDFSGNNNHGALEGTAPTWADGIIGKAVNLPGTDERVDCGNGAPLDQIGNGSFSVSFWMKSKNTTPNSYGMLFSKYQGGGYVFHFCSPHISARLNISFTKGGVGIGNTAFSVATNPFDTNWNHIVLVINRTTDKALLYMNTIKDITEIDISSVPADGSNTGNIAWGAYHYGIFPYEGLIDEAKIYNRVLTQEEINKLYETAK